MIDFEDVKNLLRRVKLKYLLLKGGFYLEEIDAGAYQGWFTVYAAKKAKKGHVYCFEPDEGSRRVLEKNLKFNKLKNVTIVPEVLSGKTGNITFCETNTCTASIYEANLICKSNPVTKKSSSLKDFLTKHKIKTVDFLKMDVEGAEYSIVSGSEDFIKNHVEFMAIASYHELNGRPSSELLEPLFSNLGFEVETTYPTHQTTYAWKKRLKMPL